MWRGLQRRPQFPPLQIGVLGFCDPSGSYGLWSICWLWFSFSDPLPIKVLGKCLPPGGLAEQRASSLRV